MPINLTCLDTYPPLPVIPLLANDSATTSVHPKYTPDSGGLAQVISSSIINSVFSTDDVRSLLRRAFNDDSEPWNDFSDVASIKPIPSIIIYSSIALALFLVLSLVFCVVSCLKFGKRTPNGRKRAQSRGAHVCICLVIVVYLLGIGDMIYVAYRVNESKVSIDETIQYVNHDLYPKEVSDHLVYLIHQMENLDRYCIDPDSILINASKSMIIETFGKVLNEKYLLPNITQALNGIDQQIQDLNRIVEQDASISQAAKDIYTGAKSQYQSMVNSLQMPLQEVCRYASGAQTDIDDKLFQALDLVHQQLRKLINTVQRDILDKIAASDSPLIMDAKLEDEVRGYANMSGTIFLVLVIFLTIIPVAFASFTVLSCCCRGDRSESSSNQHHDMRLGNMNAGSSKRYSYRSHKSPQHFSQDDSDEYSDSEYSNKRPSCVLLCLMRIAFGIMIIMLIVMASLTGVYYALDLAIHSGCRTVHDDQSFLIPFITDRVVRTTTAFANSSDLNTTVSNVIEDCRDRVHFTRRLMTDYWHTLDLRVRDMMNELNKQIYDQFNASIGQIDIPDEIALFAQFVSQTGTLEIVNKITHINANLNKLEMTLANISSAGTALPANVTESTIVEFTGYVRQVLESTLDGCPLPLDMIYRADTLVCHQLGGAISGLWLSVFFYMFVITLGLCIFGVWAYKRSI